MILSLQRDSLLEIERPQGEIHVSTAKTDIRKALLFFTESAKTI